MNKKKQKECVRILEEIAEIPRIQQRERNTYHSLESWKTDLFSDVFMEAEQRAGERWEEYSEVTRQMRRLYEEFPVIPGLLEGDAEIEEQKLSANEIEGLMRYLSLQNVRDYIIKYEIYLRGIQDGHRLETFLKE